MILQTSEHVLYLFQPLLVQNITSVINNLTSYKATGVW